VTTISDITVDRIIACSSADESNREILDTLIHMTNADRTLMKFCDAIEDIVGSTSAVVESLRNG